MIFQTTTSQAYYKANWKNTQDVFIAGCVHRSVKLNYCCLWFQSEVITDYDTSTVIWFRKLVIMHSANPVASCYKHVYLLL